MITKSGKTFKKDFFELGISKAKTPFGNEAFIYNLERTVCDMIRSRSQIEIQIFQDAMKQYIRVCFFDIKNFPLFWIKFLYVKINKIIYYFCAISCFLNGYIAI